MRFSILLALALGITATTVCAQQKGHRFTPKKSTGSQTFSAKEGLYLGLLMPYNTIGGDFSGDLVLYDDYQAVYLPKIDGSVGFGALFGLGKRGVEAEFSFSYAASDSKWKTSPPHRAKYYSFDIDSRWFLLRKSRIQPFVQAGGGIVKLVIENGSEPRDSTEYEVSDARLVDFELHPGGGVAWYFTRALSLRLSAVYRFVSFKDTWIEGAAGTIVPPRGIKANNLGLTLGFVCYL